jgi:hypothetical protein
MIWGSKPVEAEDFSPLQNFQTGPVVQWASHLMVTQSIFPGLKRPGPKVKYLHQFNSEVKNESSHISTLFTCLQGAKRKKNKFYPHQLHALRPKCLPHGPLLTISHFSVFTEFTSLQWRTFYLKMLSILSKVTNKKTYRDRRKCTVHFS